MKKLSLIFLLSILVGCTSSNDPIKLEQTRQQEPTLMSEIDGVKLYRIMDASRSEFVYFTTLGDVSSCYQKSHGKTSTRVCSEVASGNKEEVKNIQEIRSNALSKLSPEEKNALNVK